LRIYWWTDLQAIDKGVINAELYALCDSSERKVQELTASLKRYTPALMTIEELLKNVDLVVECASQNAVKSIVPQALEAGCDVMVLSVGALADGELRERLFRLAKQNNCKLYFPSRCGCWYRWDKFRVSSGNLLSYPYYQKTSSGSCRAPHVKALGIELEKIEKETVLFEDLPRKQSKPSQQM